MKRIALYRLNGVIIMQNAAPSSGRSGNNGRAVLEPAGQAANFKRSLPAEWRMEHKLMRAAHPVETHTDEINTNAED